MQGLCASCGKAAKLHGCHVCGASVCPECLLGYGCKVCRGIKQFR